MDSIILTIIFLRLDGILKKILDILSISTYLLYPPKSSSPPSPEKTTLYLPLAHLATWWIAIKPRSEIGSSIWFKILKMSIIAFYSKDSDLELKNDWENRLKIYYPKDHNNRTWINL